MMRFLKRNNRPVGRAYEAHRSYRSSATSVRAGSVAQSRMPVLSGLVVALFRRVKTITPLWAAILCLAALLSVSIPVALAVNISAVPEPSALKAYSEVDPAQSSVGTAADTVPPVPNPSPTPSSTPTPPPHPSNTIIREGVTASVVAEIQTRLMDLGYMHGDEPTEYFGTVTSSAISLFQRQHQLAVDGMVGMETYILLIGEDAQKYTIMEGASGEDVTEIQKRLRELGYLDKVTGLFGELTTKAVKAFQQYNGLTKDGKLGQKTRELLYSADAKAYFLKYGEQSNEVKTYQKRLKSLGFLTTEPDGKYGKDTVNAVKRFQEINGVIADGFLGPNTVELVMSGKAHANALLLGMRGNDVENVQRKLKTLGYTKHVTGYFGSETEDGVKAFQKRNGLTVDGTVGLQTMSKLTSGSAKKAASGSSGSSSSSPSSINGIDKFISIAESKIGKKYIYGAKGPNSFDCSGFVYFCLNQAGVKQGYLTSSGWAATNKYQKITRISDCKRGDILVFSGNSAGHVGIYLGNGRMIDASSANGKVVKRSGIWDGSYWRGVFICAFRVY